MIVGTFHELEVYKLAFDLQQKIYEASKQFPKEETYSLTDQIRRSSRSTGANISEAWRKRRYPAHFASKLTDSDGENAETQHWIATAQACGYWPNEFSEELLQHSKSIGTKLGHMIQNADSWQPR